MAAKPAFATGAQVEHVKFGLGSVQVCNEEHVSIKFDDHGEKKFVLAIVLPNLRKSDRTPPPEKRKPRKAKAPGTTTKVAKKVPSGTGKAVSMS